MTTVAAGANALLDGGTAAILERGWTIGARAGVTVPRTPVRPGAAAPWATLLTPVGDGPAAPPPARRRGRRRRWLGLAAVVVAALVVVLGGRGGGPELAPPVPVPPVTTASGVFCTGPGDSCAGAFARWRGRDVALVSSYLPGEDWAGIEVPDWWQDKWRGSAYRDRMLVSVPMLPADRSQTLEHGAAGDYDEHFRTTARRLVGLGMAGAWIRPGWEANGSWSRSSARAHPEQYAAAFRHLVTAMRSVPGARFRFDWNVATGSHGWDSTKAYPGDDYVDAVGQDVYDMEYGQDESTPQSRWANLVAPATGSHPYGLQFWADFASAHGKPLSYAEWGLVGAGSSMADGGHGGDDPYFITQMGAWFAEHPTAFETYFDVDAPDGSHLLTGGRFPRAARAYQQLSTRATAMTPASPGRASASPSPSAPAVPRPSPSAGARAGSGAGPGVPVLVSRSSDRADARPLEGATLSGEVYVFVPVGGASEVRFFLDDAQMQGQPFRTEVSRPFDLAGGSGSSAQPLDTSLLAPGRHTLLVSAMTPTGTSVTRCTFDVAT